MGFRRRIRAMFLPVTSFLSFSFGMHYFKPKSAVLAIKWGQFRDALFPLTIHSYFMCSLIKGMTDSWAVPSWFLFWVSMSIRLSPVWIETLQRAMRSEALYNNSSWGIDNKRITRTKLLLIRLLKFLITWLTENWLLDDPGSTLLCNNAIDPFYEDHDPILGLKQKEDMDESPYDFR